MEIIYPMVVDLARPNKYNTLLVMKNDFNSRKCRFILMSDGKPFDTSDVISVTVKAVKPDESVVFDDAEVLTDQEGDPINEVLYSIPAGITDTTGKTTMTLTLNAQGSQLSSFEFYINTRNELYSEDDYASEDDLAGFRDLLNRALATVERVSQMAQQSALPNPQPLVLTDQDGSTNYTGAERVEYNLTPIQQRMSNIESSFEGGCRTIAQAVTNNGVPTSDAAGQVSVSEIVTNIGKIRSGGTAGAGQILTGFNAYVGKQLINGGMPNNGGGTKANLNCGGSYTIPAGYHDGSGKVIANSLASQTSVDSGKTAISAAVIRSGYQGWVNGSKISGTMTNYTGSTTRSTLNCGGSYTIPAGYHDGNGVVKANSLASQTGVDSGKTAISAGVIRSGYQGWVNGAKVSGTMPNYTGATTRSTLNCGGSYTIPAGYHDGNGVVKANSLASQTVPDTGKYAISAGAVLSGYQGYVNGNKITGNIASKASATYTPGTSNQTISKGVYLSGDQTIKGDASLVPGNIRSGATIFGVAGTYSPTITATTKTLQMTGHTGSYAGNTGYIEAYNSSRISGHIIHCRVSVSEKLTVSGSPASPTVSRQGGLFDVWVGDAADSEAEIIHMTFYLAYA